MDAATFRAATAPAFDDLIAFPPEAVDYWLGVAATRLPALIWGDNLSEGLVLFTAHRLALGRQAASSASGAPVSSKSVGGVSIAYNWEAATVEGAGAYNLTPYGREFWQLVQMIGMGVVQL